MGGRRSYRAAERRACEQGGPEGRVGEVHEEAGYPGVERLGIEGLAVKEMLRSYPIDEEVNVQLRLKSSVEEGTDNCHQ